MYRRGREGRPPGRWGRPSRVQMPAPFAPVLAVSERRLPSPAGKGSVPAARRLTVRRAPRTNVQARSAVEVEVARRLLLEPEPVVLGRLLEEVRRLLEHVLVGLLGGGLLRGRLLVVVEAPLVGPAAGGGGLRGRRGDVLRGRAVPEVGRRVVHALGRRGVVVGGGRGAGVLAGEGL